MLRIDRFQKLVDFELHILRRREMLFQIKFNVGGKFL